MKNNRLWASGLVVFWLCAGNLPAQQTDSDPATSATNPSVASQPVPRLIVINGNFKDQAGKPLTGPVDLNFAIYKSQNDATPLWEEGQTLNLDEQGHYTVLLGAMHPEGLPTELFTTGEARWLGVSTGRACPEPCEGLPEQARLLLASVPYALEANDAQMLGGKPASAYMLAQPAEGTPPGGLASAGGAQAGVPVPPTPENARAGKTKSSPKPDVAGTGVQNYIPVWTDSAGTLGNSVMYQSAGLVGVGTTSPAVALDVYGTNAGLRLRGAGTHQVQVTGVTSGRLGQDAVGFFFASDTNGAPIRFATNNGARNEWMRITSAGLVGIGTTVPAHKLDVAGDINASSNINAGGNLTVTGTITGNGSGLTNVAASSATTASGLSCSGCVGNTQLSVNYAGSTSQGGAASNALLLNGLPSSAFQAAGTSAGLGANTFTATQTISSGDLSISGGNLNVPQTTRASVGVFELGGNPFMHACCSAAQYNTFVGSYAGNFTTIGNGNAASGYAALSSNVDGSDNSASGYSALFSNTSGDDNTASGNGALFSNTTGSFNTASGVAALYANTTAAFNTALGYYAGLTSTAEYASVTGANNTFLGALSGPGTSTPINNATAIGYGAVVSASNALVLGSIAGVNDATASVNVGIGTTTPMYTLDVNGTGNFTGLVTFAGGQTFPGTGTVTGVTAGTGLSGGGTSGNVTLNNTGVLGIAAGSGISSSGGQTPTLSVSSGAITNTMLANPGLTVNPGTGLTGGGSVALGGTTTLNVDPSVVAKLGNANTFSASQSVAGNLTVSGVTSTNSLAVTSSTQVPNLNASYVGGYPAGAFRTQGIVYLAGCDSCGPLESTDSQRQFYVNVVGAMTIHSVTCFSDLGGPTINIARDNGGPTNLLSGNLTCSPGGASTTSFTSSALNLNDQLDFVMVTADGTASRATVVIQATLN